MHTPYTIAARHSSANSTATAQNTAATYVASHLRSPSMTHRAPEHPPLRFIIRDTNATTAIQNITISAWLQRWEDKVGGPPGC